MMYSGSKLQVVQACEITKVYEVRSVEELDDDWLADKLKFFK